MAPHVCQIKFELGTQAPKEHNPILVFGLILQYFPTVSFLFFFFFY